MPQVQTLQMKHLHEHATPTRSALKLWRMVRNHYVRYSSSLNISLLSPFYPFSFYFSRPSPSPPLPPPRHMHGFDRGSSMNSGGACT
eukprot:754062-Hanusia_phi.AAC.1